MAHLQKHVVLLAAVLLPAVSAFAQAPLEERIRRVENSLHSPSAEKGKPATRKHLGDQMKRHGSPGVSVAVIENGRIDWAKGYGVVEAGQAQPVTPETVFQAASISKPVAAVAAMRLVEQGVLALDEDVNLRLKSWRIPESKFTSKEKVTLRRLLSHTAGLTVSGFPGYGHKPGAPLPPLRQILDGVHPANTSPIRVQSVPGTKAAYSGGGYMVVQQLLIDVTGKPFPELLQELVLGPAGMVNSTFVQPLPSSWRGRAAKGHTRGDRAVEGGWHVYPEQAAAGLWTTPSDLARFAMEMQKALAGRSRLLSAASARVMLSPQTEGYGLGFTLSAMGRSVRFGHDGMNEGFECMLVAFRARGQGAVVMTNGRNGRDLAEEILRAIAKEYGWPE